MDSPDETGGGEPPESLLPYQAWMTDAWREVMLRALEHVAAEGLPGEHHFYLTFRTDHPATVIPSRVRAKYPDEMTVVLQHQFDDLLVDRKTGVIGVRLSFGGVSAPLTIPVAAVTAFADPAARFGLRFAPADAPSAAPEEEPAAPEPEPSAQSEPQVVSLDAFRRRKD